MSGSLRVLAASLLLACTNQVPEALPGGVPDAPPKSAEAAMTPEAESEEELAQIRAHLIHLLGFKQTGLAALPDGRPVVVHCSGSVTEGQGILQAVGGGQGLLETLVGRRVVVPDFDLVGTDLLRDHEMVCAAVAEPHP